MNRLASTFQLISRAHRAERARPLSPIRPDETRFLPAALEIVERPVSPTARYSVRLLLGGLAITSAWITFGRVDTVTSAAGEIVPASFVKPIAPTTSGIVRAIHVEDGRKVKKGELLMELDPTLAGADFAQAEAALSAAELDLGRNRAVLSALAGGALTVALPKTTSTDVVQEQRALARQTVAQVRADLAARLADRGAARAAYDEASVQLAKADAALPLLEDEVSRYAELARQGYVSKIRMLEIDRQRIAATQDRLAARANRARAAAAAEAATHAAEQSLANDKVRILADLVRAQAQVALQREELIKMRKRVERQDLISPVDGIVSQLSVHTIGGVVEGGRPLMTIVPLAGPLVAQVKLLNRDVASVHVGDPVNLKVSAYPFTRYGTVRGRVAGISADAIADTKRGLVYVVRISVERQAGKLRLAPGMEVVADIRTGRRTLLSYLLSPLRATAADALRED